MPLKLITAGGGSVILDANTTGSTYTINVPAEGGSLLTSGSQSGLNASALSVGTTPKARMPTGSILQVVNALKTDVFSTATNGFVDVTGISASITPLSSSSKILINISLGGVGMGDGSTGPHTCIFRIDRNGSNILAGDAAGSRNRGAFRSSIGLNQDHSHSYSYTGVDSPATTSALTYKLQMYTQSGVIAYINRTKSDSDGSDAYQSRTSSSITLMEIAG